ncbi:hypothetical protein DEU56DRAFT_932358 [Suillus clintonianus]|uniref:uncharacterized protein n=1 Tax=Suillus clintonianus TaxID=1904413 RepID=UPI001B87451D|nr:uncharacterized protein DEU56DRAFT_932358 [Suillus clintonianus]KAG2116267.1 hypothetical protein DEU56DRAFT_932358 [Suillus clintonianus]
MVRFSVLVLDPLNRTEPDRGSTSCCPIPHQRVEHVIEGEDLRAFPSLEDIYRSHMETTRSGQSANVDSARTNLAGTFVNTFVDAGFGNDQLMVEADKGNSWVYENKDHGDCLTSMMSAAASLGLGLLWDMDVGFSYIDRYAYSLEEWIKVFIYTMTLRIRINYSGRCIFATGLLNASVRTQADATLALLAEHAENKSVPLKISAIMGLGVAYSGSHREDLLTLLLPAVADNGASMEITAINALSLGFVFVGSGNGEITSKILQPLMERQAQILVEVCSFVATGNVLWLQRLLHLCGEHLDALKEKEQSESAEGKKYGARDEKKEEKKSDDTFQSFTVLGTAMTAMGEDIGSQMSRRQFNHLVHYGDPIIRRSVPLALGLISTSNSQLTLFDMLSQYNHNHDLAIALNDIFAMGFVGAGTNNAQLAEMLCQLAGYYYREPR